MRKNISTPPRKNYERKNFNQWIVLTVLLTVISFCLFASITIYIDPFFHYHAPLDKYSYPINDERYQNDGITKHFEYDSIITGTSMSENFKTSEADKLFNANFIKVPFSGATYKEINDALERAYNAKSSIKNVIRCLDYSLLIDDKDRYRLDTYPTYLYNQNIFDDVNYVLNKSVLFTNSLNVMRYTSEGQETTSFDTYANWMQSHTFGADTVLGSYSLPEKASSERILSEEEKTIVFENIRQNVTELAAKHPETTFYYFFSPYSICYWDTLNNSGTVNWRIDAEQLAIEEILKVPNIKLYSFCNNFDLICDLNNYKDQAHYGEWVNSQILEWMYNDEYLLTKDNYLDYIESIREFYNSYDYSSLRK